MAQSFRLSCRNFIHGLAMPPLVRESCVFRSKLARSATVGLVALSLGPSLAVADPGVALPSGQYAVVTDGARGTLSIENGTASLAIAGQACSGGIKGTLRQEVDGTLSFSERMGNDSCDIILRPKEGAMAQIDAGPGCSYFHGASCDFSGKVTEPAVAVDIKSIMEGFKSFDVSGRKTIQQTLKERDLYTGAIDGLDGVNTRKAIIAAGQIALRHGESVALDESQTVQNFLTTLLPAIPAASPTPTVTVATNTSPAKKWAFIGSWTCDDIDSNDADGTSASFVFTDSAMTMQEMGQQTQYSDVAALGQNGTAFKIDFKNHDIAYVFEASQAHMFLLALGTVSSCRPHL